ncbi:MAG: hypothetical protein GWP08_13700 [Nitrospiraceae bacterium]|nr:hypothetical protein [Nitrospiraceae bacterium]
MTAQNDSGENHVVSPALRRIRRVIRREGLPDCVPVEIGIGPWYACKLLNATTIDLVHGSPTPQECMLEAYRRYNYDPWLWASNSVWMESKWAGEGTEPMIEDEVLCDTPEEHLVRQSVRTPLGTVSWKARTILGQPSVNVEAPIKEPERDWPAYRHFLGEHRVYPSALCVDRTMLGCGAGGPGTCLPIAWWQWVRDGGMAEVVADLLERPEFMREVFDWYTRRTLEELDAITNVDNRELIDAYFIQGSASSLSLSSLDFFTGYDLPFLKSITERTKAAGIPSHLHVCGRSFEIVALCHDETDLDIMEPLESPPGGNCDLGKVKRRFGDRLVLKGNLNTYGLLARGTVAQVQKAVKRALQEAMPGGGFWLATGDQTPADAPEENLLAMIETAREYGRY